MKYRLILPILASAGILGGAAQAAQVNFNNFSTFYQILDATNTPIPAGTGYVAVGRFDTFDNAAIAAVAGGTQAALDALAADFRAFGTPTNSINFNQGVDGYYGGAVQQPTDAGNPDGNAFVGETLYIVAGNGSDISGSTSLLVVDSNLVFLEDAPAALNVNAHLDLVLGAGGSVVLGATQAGGGTHPQTGAPVDAGAGARVAIPEPSTALLSVLGVFGLLLRRRR